MLRRTEVLFVYLAELVQGLALVTFPAASSILTSPQAQSWSLNHVLQTGLSANLLAMAL